MPELELRAPTLEDLPELTEFFAAIEREWGHGGALEPEIRDWLTSPLQDPAEDFRVALTGGRIVGWSDLWDQNREHERLFLGARSHPRDLAVYRALLEWGEDHAERIANGAAGSLRCGAPSDDPLLAAELQERGYRPLRHFFTMAIGLDSELPAPEWPGGIDARTFRGGDEQAFFDADTETFADHWDFVPIPYEDWNSYFVETERFDPTLWFVAEDNAQLAGFAMCLNERRPNTGHVEVLGVRRPWRRRGLARALLLHAFAEFKRRGRTRADLGVDAENLTGAVRLYERAGMHVAHRFDAVEKKLNG